MGYTTSFSPATFLDGTTAEGPTILDTGALIPGPELFQNAQNPLGLSVHPAYQMALSVSGFPEPSRQLVPGNEVFTGENAPDGSNKTTLMNSPRLRGLFGASGTPTKRPDTRLSSTTSKAEETEGAINPSTPPIATSSIAFASSFEPLPQEEYELELQIPMASSSTTPESHRSVKRPQLPPLPRKTAASPVRLGPSLTRLDIGAFSRAPATLHPHSKAPPPSVVVEDWAPKLPDATARPLPNVPSATTDSGKKVVDEYKSTDIKSAPVAGPSRHVNAVASSSKHVNAIAGPSRQPNATAGSSKHPLALNAALPAPSIVTPIVTKPSPPASKVVTHQPSQRGHKASAPSLSMRYQPLVAESIPPTESEPSTENTLTSPVRPLPRIPPPAPAPAPATGAIIPPSPNPSSKHSAPVDMKRLKTSASAVSSFPVGSAPNAVSRSPFDNVTTWRSRPAITSNHALRASSPPLPISSPTIGPRSRSHSRPRRDRSLDPYYPLNKPALLHGVPPITTNVSGGRNPRSVPSPVIPGARPLIKGHTLEHLSSKAKPFPIQTSVTSGRGETSSSGRVLSPGGGRRSQPPTPPAGPVRPRPKAVSLSSPNPPTISVMIPVQPQPMRPAQRTVDMALPLIEVEIDKDKNEAGDAPLHAHPMDAFTDDNDSLLHAPASPATEESPIEVYIDDQDLSTLSRDPSPIRYARPDSRGHLSDPDELEELDFASTSSTASSPSSSPTRRRRTQLRSYRMSYRPHAERTSPPAIPFRERDPLPKAVPPVEDRSKEDKKKDKKKQKKKYFDLIDFGGGSAPTTRASSPERKSRSRQPRKLADTVSLKLDEVRNKGRMPSTSPKRKLQQHLTAPSVGSNAAPGPGVVMEVLDISRPKTSRRSTAATTDTTGSSSLSDHIPTLNSARSSAKFAWGKAPVTGGNSRLTGSSGHLHNNAGMPTFTKDEVEEYPYARHARTPRRTVSPAPPLPTPHHSFRSEDYTRPRTQSVTGGSKPQPGEFNIVTTVTASRPPSSSTSSPFSAFSMSNRSSTRSKTKHASNHSVALPVDENVLVIQPESTAVQVNTEEVEEVNGAGEVSARMVMRTVDSGGDIWEHERKEDMADVIPHLRQLKAKR